MKDALRKACCLVSTICPLLAWAGFDEALKSYQARDYAAARTEAGGKCCRCRGCTCEPAAQRHGSGGPGRAADAEQAVAHFGEGCAGRHRRCLLEAGPGLLARCGGGERSRQGAGLRRKAASLGDPEGAFFFPCWLTNEYQSYMNANGKSDGTRYFQLAKRPLSERSIDTEAQDALYWSADKGFRWRSLHARAESRGHDRDGNRKRMLSLAESSARRPRPYWQNYEGGASHGYALGTAMPARSCSSTPRPCRWSPGR